MKLTQLVTRTGLALAIASPALAQSAPPSAPVGIYLSVEGGALLKPQTASAVGFEIGEHVHRNVIAYATLSYFDNLMSDDLASSLGRLSQVVTARTGRAWDLQGRDRGLGFIVGAKYVAGQGVVRPYVGGGAGALAIRRRITDRLAGDVTVATFTDFGVGDAALTTDRLTRPLAEAAVGVDLEFGRTSVDVGYRVRRSFYSSQTPAFSQVVVGFGVNF